MSTAPVTPLLLREGDRLTRDEFLRRWEAMPELERAELIDGVVHLPSPLSTEHGDDVSFVDFWLFLYSFSTPGCRSGIEATWLMGSGPNAPQPDIALRVLPEHGGRSRIEQSLSVGIPELIVEVSYSSGAYDLGSKLQLYERSGVPEYITWVIRKRRIVWRELKGSKYREIAADADGIMRSRVFPGLWLDPEAMLSDNRERVVEVLNLGIASPEHAEFVRRLNAAKQK